MPSPVCLIEARTVGEGDREEEELHVVGGARPQGGKLDHVKMGAGSLSSAA